MKVFIDENIPAITVRELRSIGHDVKDIRGTKNEGMTDEDIWKMLRKEKRLLITTDKGFIQKRREKCHVPGNRDRFIPR
jgi:predicted nuclease of predicted toxin-antitoxin system